MALPRRAARYSVVSLCYFCGVCATVFLTGNILIYQSWNFSSVDVEPGAAGGGRAELLLLLPPTDRTEWRFGGDRWRPQKSPGGEYGVLASRFRKLMQDSAERRPAARLLNCDDVRSIDGRTYLASGWTKAVYSGTVDGKRVALKTVDIGGQDVSDCVGRGLRLGQCYFRAAQKIVKEIVLLQELASEHIVKVLGYCVPTAHYNGDDSTLVALITELGETVDLIKLLQMSWEDRLRISYDLTKLIHFLSYTPYGSVAMNDFRRQQFVLVGGVLKLTDVDDVGFDEPKCVSDNDCVLHFSSANFTSKTQCRDGRCVGMNEKKNLFNGGRHFTTFLLPHGSPASLRPLVDRVVDGFSSLTRTTKELLGEMDKIVGLYRTGRYLNRTLPTHFQTEYKKYNKSDLPGQFDYRCRFSLSGTGCTLSVFDQKEAEHLCNSDPQCRGFVLSNQRTWSGRQIVHFKSDIGASSRNPDTQLYVRPP